MSRDEWDRSCVRSALIWYERGERKHSFDTWRPLDVREAMRVLGISEQDIVGDEVQS